MIITNAPSAYSYKNPKAKIKTKNIKLTKPKNELRVYIIDANGIINTIS